MSREGLWTAFQGMWLSSSVLLPLGIFLTYKSAVDATLFNTEQYIKFWDKTKQKFFKSLEERTKITKKNLYHKKMDTILNSIEEAVEDIKSGKFVIVVDDKDRENEGDFICAAEKMTPEMVNFMITHGRGVLCAPLTEERCDQLNLEMQVEKTLQFTQLLLL